MSNGKFGGGVAALRRCGHRRSRKDEATKRVNNKQQTTTTTTTHFGCLPVAVCLPDSDSVAASIVLLLVLVLVLVLLLVLGGAGGECVWKGTAACGSVNIGDVTVSPQRTDAKCEHVTEHGCKCVLATAR